MHRRFILPLALLLAFILGALQAPALQPAAVAAVPPPPEARQAAALLSVPTPIALTEFDVRFHAVAVDGGGQTFVAAPWPGSKIRICRLIRIAADQYRLEPIYDLPGSKHASVALAVLQDGTLLVTYSSRPEGAIDGPFPLYAVPLRGIATPQSGFGALMPMVPSGAP